MRPGEWIVQFCLFIDGSGHNQRLDEGDVLVVIGPNEEIDRIRQDLAP